MNYPTIFHLISDITKKTGISCILIGGFAVNYYKVTRQTADVDFLITREDFEKVLSLLEKEGYKQDDVQEVFVRLKSNRFYLIDIDFMFVDRETFESLVESGKNITIAGQKFLVPSLNNLIALKLHSLKHNLKIRKNKDLPDIVNLVRIHKIDVKSEEFKDLCFKYGTKEIYDRILDDA